MVKINLSSQQKKSKPCSVFLTCEESTVFFYRKVGIVALIASLFFNLSCRGSEGHKKNVKVLCDSAKKEIEANEKTHPWLQTSRLFEYAKLLDARGDKEQAERTLQESISSVDSVGDLWIVYEITSAILLYCLETDNLQCVRDCVSKSKNELIVKQLMIDALTYVNERTRNFSPGVNDKIKKQIHSKIRRYKPVVDHVECMAAKMEISLCNEAILLRSLADFHMNTGDCCGVKEQIERLPDAYKSRSKLHSFANRKYSSCFPEKTSDESDKCGDRRTTDWKKIGEIQGEIIMALEQEMGVKRISSLESILTKAVAIDKESSDWLRDRILFEKKSATEEQENPKEITESLCVYDMRKSSYRARGLSQKDISEEQDSEGLIKREIQEFVRKGRYDSAWKMIRAIKDYRLQTRFIAGMQEFCTQSTL